MYSQFRVWTKAVVLEQIFSVLIEQALVEEITLMLDSTTVKIHQHTNKTRKGTITKKPDEVKKIVSGAIADIPDGKDGASAYEIAVENGYTGTPEEWLESLQGKKGDSGKAATIEIGEVITVEAGEPAGVENVGTETKAMLKFTIPRGERGLPGSGGGSGGSGLYAFEIREDGHLWLISETETDAERFYINAAGHLIYRMEG